MSDFSRSDGAAAGVGVAVPAEVCRAPAPERAESLTGGRAALRAVEFIVLFAVMPAVLAANIRAFLVFPALFAGAAFCAAVLWRDPTFERRRLWNAAALRRCWRVVLPVFLVGAGVLAVLTMAVRPDRLFWLVQHRPLLWLLIMTAYPVLSVYPQELIFRTFLFHRYGALLRPGWLRIAVSSLAFGYAHIVMLNGLAIALSVAGGALFAWTYWRTGSTLAAALEHALYGCFVFTIGLGWYFVAGMPG